MSAQSIVAAVKTILANGVGQFQQVEDLDAVPFAIFPQNTPCALLQLMREPEVPVTHGRSRVDADLDVHMWQAVSAPTPLNAETFKGLVNDTVVELRAHPRLDGNADVPGESQVLISGRRLSTLFTRPIITPSKVWLHAVVTDRIVEFVQTPL